MWFDWPYLVKSGFWWNVCWNIILKVKEWLQNLGIGDATPVVQDDDEADDEAISLHHPDDSVKHRWIPPPPSSSLLFLFSYFKQLMLEHS